MLLDSIVSRPPISIAPSISIAARLAERTPRVAAQLVAFGNPTINPDVADPLPDPAGTRSAFVRCEQVWKSVCFGRLLA